MFEIHGGFVNHHISKMVGLHGRHGNGAQLNSAHVKKKTIGKVSFSGVPRLAHAGGYLEDLLDMMRYAQGHLVSRIEFADCVGIEHTRWAPYQL